ncbi:MAG TPA: ornithine carbamoyltransferase [Candidatus Chromulinivoraceae bacterium]|nr:ornithine carbamoyltransferase [Candidatus Chromulinivoraceae bacterium]
MQETSFKGRSLLTLADYSPEEIQYMLDMAKKYKELKRAGTLHWEHEGKSIALLFEKASTRTRCAFVVAAADLGIHPEYLGKDDIQLGKKETVEDTAKVLGRMFDGIEFRGFAHETVVELARHAGVPVWNGLTDAAHPTQVLADFLTIQERLQRLKGVKFVFVGDGRNNMANSLMEGAAKMGMDFRIAAPRELFPDDGLVTKAKEYAKDTGATITITDNLKEAVADADIIYTDVWVSMGEEAQFAERIKLLKDYQVTMDVIQATGNANVMFMHCLPAFHDRLTVTGEQVYQQYGLDSMEVTDEVFRSEHSIVFDQAENRLHTIKAVIALTV